MKTFNIQNMTRNIVLMAVIFLVSGCATMKNKMLVDNMRPMMDKMKFVVNRSGDLELVQASMAQGIVQMDSLIELVPDDNDLLVRAAELNQGYAYAFLHDTRPALAAEYYKKSRDYMLRVLRTKRGFSRAIEKGGNDLDVFLRSLTKQDVQALYLFGGAWMNWISVVYKDKADVLEDIPKVMAVLTRVIELDDTYYYGGAHAILGAYYGSRPEEFGGNPKDSASQFEQAMDISKDKFLLWKMMYGQYYAVQVRDKALFTKTLEGVVATPEDPGSEVNFLNTLAKAKAKRLLDQISTMF